MKLFGFSLFNDNELISPEWLLQNNFLVFDLISSLTPVTFGIETPLPFLFASNVVTLSYNYIMTKYKIQINI